MSEKELRRQIAQVCHRIYAKGFVAAKDGNVSARLDAKRILVTPSGLPKGEVTPASLILCDLAGRKIRGRLGVTSELPLHLAVYEQRADVRAAVHAHPPYSTALTVAGVSLADAVLPEVVISLGRICTAKYATPSTSEVPRSVANIIRRCDAVLLERHGVLTVGTDPWDAYYKLEKVEHAAKVVTLARLLGRVKNMSRRELKKLVDTFRRRGVTPKISLFEKL